MGHCTRISPSLPASPNNNVFRPLCHTARNNALRTLDTPYNALRTLDTPYNTLGQTFCDLHTHLHLFQIISHLINPARCNFLLSYHVIDAYFELYPFLHIYMRFSPSEMHDFSLRDLHTFFLSP